MNFELFAFYGFATVMLASAMAVVAVRNTVYAALFLVLTFFTTACLWLLAQAEFLAIALVLVYVGAVMVLFLFVVMMLDIKVSEKHEGFTRYLPLGLVVAVIMALEMLALIGVKRFAPPSQIVDPATEAGLTNIEWLGQALFTDYLLPFELAGIILMVAIVVAIGVTMRRRPDTKHQNATRQVAVRKEDRLRIVKMAAETGKEEGQ